MELLERGTHRRAAEPEEALLVTPVQLSIRRTALVAPHVPVRSISEMLVSRAPNCGDWF